MFLTVRRLLAFSRNDTATLQPQALVEHVHPPDRMATFIRRVTSRSSSSLPIKVSICIFPSLGRTELHVRGFREMEGKPIEKFEETR